MIFTFMIWISKNNVTLLDKTITLSKWKITKDVSILV